MMCNVLQHVKVLEVCLEKVIYHIFLSVKESEITFLKFYCLPFENKMYELNKAD